MSQWQMKLAHRLGQLERGKVYTLVFFVPDDGEEPAWSVQHEAKLENAR